jgi:hypothetical protein
MLQKSAIIEVRQRLGIPEDGFPIKALALMWYRNHYKRVTGKQFKGNFGFQYDYSSQVVDFEYDLGLDSMKIYIPAPLDEAVPLDKEALSLASEEKVPSWAAPVFRPVILIGELPEMIELRIPSHLTSTQWDLHILIHPIEELSLRNWRKVGQALGLLEGTVRQANIACTTTTYSPKRENKMEDKYLQTLWAYLTAVEERKRRGIKGRKGLLKETGQILKERYGWDTPLDSYVVRRYLDRAEKLWHISTR